MFQFTTLKSVGQKGYGSVFLAARTTSEASVSTSNGILSCMAETTALAMILFRSSNACFASEDKGNDLQVVMGLFLLEKLGTH